MTIIKYILAAISGALITHRLVSIKHKAEVKALNDNHQVSQNELHHDAFHAGWDSCMADLYPFIDKDHYTKIRGSYFMD